MSKQKVGEYGIPLDASLRSYDAKAVSDQTAREAAPHEVYLVQQQFAQEVDINEIVHRFGITGATPFGGAQGVYGDFTGITDYESALAKIKDADARFMKLPAEVRDRFANDPAMLIRAANELPVDEFARRFELPEVPAGGGVQPPIDGS